MIHIVTNDRELQINLRAAWWSHILPDSLADMAGKHLPLFDVQPPKSDSSINTSIHPSFVIHHLSAYPGTNDKRNHRGELKIPSCHLLDNVFFWSHIIGHSMSHNSLPNSY